jgi:type IV secretory pathway TrbF-like protein
MTTKHAPGSDEPYDAARSEEDASAGALLQEAEAWEPWETKLVGYSIALAIAALIILGWLINMFILK